MRRGLPVLWLLNVDGDKDPSRLPVMLPQERHRRHQPTHRFVRGPTPRTTDLNVLQDRREPSASPETVGVAPTRVGKVAVSAGQPPEAAAGARAVALRGGRVPVEATRPEAAVEGRGARAVGAVTPPVTGTKTTRTAAAVLPTIAGRIPEVEPSTGPARPTCLVRGAAPELLLPAVAVHEGAARGVGKPIKKGHPLVHRTHSADYPYCGVLKERCARSPYR